MKEENKKSRVKVLSLILVLAMVISLMPVGSVNVGAADKVSVQAVQSTDDVDSNGYSYQFITKVKKGFSNGSDMLAYAKYKKQQSVKRGGNIGFEYVCISAVSNATGSSISASLNKDVDTLTAKELKEEVAYASKLAIKSKLRLTANWSVNGIKIDDVTTDSLNTSTALHEHIDFYEKEAEFKVIFCNSIGELNKSITMKVTSWIDPVSEVTGLDSEERNLVGSNNNVISKSINLKLPGFTLNKNFPTNHAITVQKYRIEKYNATSRQKWSVEKDIAAYEGESQTYAFQAKKNETARYRVSLYYAYNSYDKDLIYQSDYKYVTLNFLKCPFSENMSLKSDDIYAAVGEDVVLDSDICINRGYQAEYIWQKLNSRKNAFEDIADAKSAVYEIKNVKSEDFGDYRCVVKAYKGTGEDKKYITSKTLTYHLTDKKKFMINKASDTYEDSAVPVYKPINSEAELSLDVKVNSGYKASFQWFKQGKDYSTMEMIDGATEASYKLNVTADSFTKYSVKMTVTNENDASDSETHEYSYRIWEDPQIEKVYTSGASDNDFYLKEGEDLVIVANKYKCNPNYTLVYEWYRYDILDGGKSYKNTKIEGTTGNVLTIKDHKNTDETNYRYYVKAYRNGESETHRGSETEIYSVHNYGRDKQSNLSVSHATNDTFYKHDGEPVSMGVKAECDNADCYDISYSWFLNGEELHDADGNTYNTPTYSVDKLAYGLYGKYTCMVTAKAKENSYAKTESAEETAEFTVNEASGYRVNSPSKTNVNGKNTGDTITLTADVSTVDDKEYPITYAWYKKVADPYDGNYGEYVKVGSAKDFTITLSKYDFTQYECYINDGLNSKATILDYFVNAPEDRFKLVSITGNNTYKVMDGEKVTLEARAVIPDASDTITYQWYRNGGVIDGATDMNYTIDSVSENDINATFLCVATSKNTGKTAKYTFYLSRRNSISTSVHTGLSLSSGRTYKGTRNLGSKETIGVDLKTAGLSYDVEWTFTAESYVNGKKQMASKSVKLDEKNTVITFDSLTEEQFGEYQLNIYKKGTSYAYTTYTFKITRYTGYFSAAPKGNYTTYYRKKGESVTFNIGVKTDLKDTVYYQWYKDGIAIFGQTNSSLTIENIDYDDYGRYYCAVRCGESSVQTTDIKLKTDTGLELEFDYYNAGTTYYYLTKALTDTAEFSVKASSKTGRQIAYRWFKSSTAEHNAISGAVSPELKIENIKADDYGSYICEVTDGVMTKYAYFGIRGVSDELKWESTGGDKYINAGECAEFQAKAVCAAGYNISYKWQRYNEAEKRYEDIASASDSSYKTDAITDFDFGYTRYKCIASTEISDIERIFYVYNADRFDFNGTADRTWIFDDEAAVYTTTLKNNTNDTPKYQWYKKDDNGNFIPVKGADKDIYIALAPAVTATKSSMTYRCEVKAGKEESYVTKTKDFTTTIYKRTYLKDTLPQAKADDGYSFYAYRVDGASKLKITFSEDTLFDKNINYCSLAVLDKNGNKTSYVGSELSGKTITVDGDEATFMLFSNVSSYPTYDFSKQGYKVTKIESVKAADGGKDNNTSGDNSNNGGKDENNNTSGDNSNNGGNSGNNGSSGTKKVTKVKKKISIGLKESVSLYLKGAKYKTSKNKYVTVSKKGVIKGKKKGKSTVTVTTAKKIITYTVTVKAAPKKIKKVSPSKIKLKVKKTKKIKVTLPKNTASYKISFKSSNKKIVKVDSKGKVKALKKGRAKITIKTFNGKKKTIKVTVKK